MKMRKVRVLGVQLVRCREEARQGGRAGERTTPVSCRGEGEEGLGGGGGEDEEEDGEQAVCGGWKGGRRREGGGEGGRVSEGSA